MANNNEMSLELKPEIARGEYSNLAIITHSHSEFVLDFATMLPGLPKPQISNRLIMTPEHAKRLLHALNENISKYESAFGRIDLGENAPQQGATFDINNFNPGGAKS
ncbi:MAG: DUF3467 domain-containing protein [Bacteroidales bacterium]|nr:DUF3467 domain-containing protein [Bacteroidales bacterium]